MRVAWERFWRRSSGWTLVVLGVVGCVLPVLPGIPLLLGGLALLSTEYAWAEKALARLKGWVSRTRARRGQQEPPQV